MTPIFGKCKFWGENWVEVCLHTQRNGRHFWRVKYSLKLGKASLHRYHVGQKVCRIRSVWHVFQDTSIFVFCNLCEKFENSKWPPFLEGQKFFANWVCYEITLSSTVLEIQAFLCFSFLKKKIQQEGHRCPKRRLRRQQ